MKKLIFILTVTTLLSCSKDDPAPVVKDCGCDKLFLQKIIIANPNGNTISDTGWQPYGPVKESTTIKDCTQNGKVVFTFQQNGTQGVNSVLQLIEHRLDCK